MSTLITIVHVTAALLLIVIVLLQTGKGASIGAVFGGGSSHTLFGNRGAGNFLTKMTTGAAIVFMLTSLGISVLSSYSKVSTISVPSVKKETPLKPEGPETKAADKTPVAVKTKEPAVTPKAEDVKTDPEKVKTKEVKSEKPAPAEKPKE